MSNTVAIQIGMTDAPKYLTHFEISLEGDNVVVQIVNRRGYTQAEAVLPREEFFELIGKLQPLTTPAVAVQK
jgi:hypothetical protein